MELLPSLKTLNVLSIYLRLTSWSPDQVKSESQGQTPDLQFTHPTFQGDWSLFWPQANALQRGFEKTHCRHLVHCQLGLGQMTSKMSLSSEPQEYGCQLSTPSLPRALGRSS